MSLLDEYRASLKSLDVEEPIDVYVHRPLGFVIAKLSFPTPISPNFITLLSIVFGIGSGAALLSKLPHNMQLAGLLLFCATILDCADGQLARMRHSSSALGRMLDGTADAVTTLSVVPPTLLIVWRRYNSPLWLSLTVGVLCIVTVVTSSFHTAMYDHFKNVYMRFTCASCSEGEDYEAARQRWEASRSEQTWWKRLSWRLYLFYVKSQCNYVLGFDPYTSTRFDSFPAYDSERAQTYARIAGPVMRVWRSVFGFGSLMFGLALFNFINAAGVFLVLRLVVLNAIFFLYLRPAQRRASRAAFRAMHLRLPDQRLTEDPS